MAIPRNDSHLSDMLDRAAAATAVLDNLRNVTPWSWDDADMMTV